MDPLVNNTWATRPVSMTSARMLVDVESRRTFVQEVPSRRHTQVPVELGNTDHHLPECSQTFDWLSFVVVCVVASGSSWVILPVLAAAAKGAGELAAPICEDSR